MIIKTDARLFQATGKITGGALKRIVAAIENFLGRFHGRRAWS